MGEAAETHAAQLTRSRPESLSHFFRYAAPAIACLGIAGATTALALGPDYPAVSQADCDSDASTRVLKPVTSPGAVRDARAWWLDRRTVLWPGAPDRGRYLLYIARNGGIDVDRGVIRGADEVIALRPAAPQQRNTIARRFAEPAPGMQLAVGVDDDARLTEWQRGEVVLVREEDGRAVDATGLQSPAALDDLYADRAEALRLGAYRTRDAGPVSTTFSLWAPTAHAVALCLYPGATQRSSAWQRMTRDATSGAWSLSLPATGAGEYYLYLVDVFVPGVGLVRNRVTDPYSLSLTANWARSVAIDLDAPQSKPAGWDHAPAPAAPAAPTDMVVYELHVRDFSASDASVPLAHRGRYLAFTDLRSRGMRHLRTLAAAGVTDLHLLPAFDFSTVPEVGCETPTITSSRGDDPEPQRRIARSSANDCFNWGYDPFHFTAPEGSYASNAADPVARVREFRQMVQALHGIGLRVGMDVVYNHTVAAGQDPRSVLDRIVPGYYQRLNATGAVETSTCCANTATEHRMMAKLMIDSVVTWAQHYRIDSFRFDLMGHQPRAVMLNLQKKLTDVVGRPVPLIGEGWNFGEVANGARFEQASQLSLGGTGIATFSDRARDAIRGGGPGDRGTDLVRRQGYVTGLHYDPNEQAPTTTPSDLRRAADQVRVGLAGTLRDYQMRNADDQVVPLRLLAYGDQPAGYAAEPGEVVNYVENHDNHTLFDNGVLKLPLATSREDRRRVQMLAIAINAFSQGIAYFHAGVETLRSKSLDRNSFDSGDWFNRLDWTLTNNNFAIGLPDERANGPDWPVLRPRLTAPAIRMQPQDIAWTNATFLDLLRIRSSSSLFRLRSAADIRQRLTFPNSGADQVPTLLVGQLDGHGYPGAGFAAIVYVINVDKQDHQWSSPSLAGQRLRLHPVQAAANAADARAQRAQFDSTTRGFLIPARTAVVFVADH